MANSSTAICNLALARAQASPINDITDTTSEAARQCGNLYPLLLDAVLRSHPWNFALKRVNLIASSTAPTFEFTYKYLLPSDCLRVLKLYDSDEDWLIEGRYLLTNESVVNIVYIFRNTDESQYDPLFVEALATKIASRLAAVLGANRTLADSLSGDYKILLAEARMMDGQEGTPRNLRVKAGWIQARHNYRAGYNTDVGNS